MKTALRRELELTGWQGLGFALGLVALVLIGYFWGSGIQGDIGDVAKRQHRDHQTVTRVQRAVKAIGGGDALLQPSHSAPQLPGPPQGGSPGHSGEPVPLTPPVSESATPPGPLTPTVEKLPEPAKAPVETVCSVADQLAHLC